MKNIILTGAFVALSTLSNVAVAGPWCTLAPGFNIQTHGNVSGAFFIEGKLDAGDTKVINFKEATAASNLSVALAAMMSGKTLMVKVDSATCEAFTSWSDGVEQLKILP